MQNGPYTGACLPQRTGTYHLRAGPPQLRVQTPIICANALGTLRLCCSLASAGHRGTNTPAFVPLPKRTTANSRAIQKKILIIAKRVPFSRLFECARSTPKKVQITPLHPILRPSTSGVAIRVARRRGGAASGRFLTFFGRVLFVKPSRQRQPEPSATIKIFCEPIFFSSVKIDLFCAVSWWGWEVSNFGAFFDFTPPPGPHHLCAPLDRKSVG